MRTRLPNPEYTAASLLDRSGQSQPRVDLRAVARLWPGLTITTEGLDGEGYLIDLGALGGEIVVRASASRARQRYTAAHELGHWYLEDRGGCQVGVAVSDRSIERWCERFASSLLIPRRWLLSDLQEHRREIAGAVRTLPERYGVSDKALRVRIAEITPLTLYDIRLDDDGVAIGRRYAAFSTVKPAGIGHSLRKIGMGAIKTGTDTTGDYVVSWSFDPTSESMGVVVVGPNQWFR